MQQKIVTTLQPCPGRLVPVGTPVVIPENSFVTLTQSLGGSYTVVYQGNMIRIDGINAAAIGFEAFVVDYPKRAPGPACEEDIWKTLRTIYDPEIPVNIVDLGLIYDVTIKPDNPGSYVKVTMTLTAPGCGMGPVLIDDIYARLMRTPNIENVDVELVFDPPWSRDMMSEEAQLQLGMY
ncbi:MAG: putative Fe-S cluster assembly protein SufT [Pseudomonadales bacterium]|nr:putative Fe-S cluster assembly protein SufT [Pseudomonadales bacterium]